MLILWSGGIDSTVVLCDALQFHYRDIEYTYPRGVDAGEFKLSKDYGIPRALTIDSEQLPQIQLKMQYAAMKNIKKSLNKKGFKFDHGILKLKTCLTDDMYGIGSQYAIWLIQAAMFVRDGEPLLVGWIKGDCATMYWHRMKVAWENLTIAINKRSELIAPYMWADKWKMIEHAKRHRILTKCWYCDEPISNKPCNNCDSCYTMIGARAILKAKKLKR